LIGLISSLLAKCSKLLILLLSVALILVIGVLDFVTGYDLSFGLFYTAPIILLSWYVSRPAALLGALLCAITWYFANSFEAPALIHQSVLLWNSAIRLGFFVAIVYPLNALREAYTRERMAARIDPLTGVANSREFKESAKVELMQLLMRIGHALKGALRATDLVGRLGGDEFAILLPDTTEDQATPVIRKIEQAVLSEANAMELTVGVSIGATTLSTLPAIIDEMIAMADARMFQAKNAKRSNTPRPRKLSAV
jgi:GGDEF domain-containing protein